jgi:hypothetical protein
LFWVLAAAVAIFAVVSLMSGSAVTGIVLVAIALVLGSAGHVLHL